MANNVVASRPPKRRPTGTLTTRANLIKSGITNDLGRECEKNILFLLTLFPTPVSALYWTLTAYLLLWLYTMLLVQLCWCTHYISGFNNLCTHVHCEPLAVLLVYCTLYSAVNICLDNTASDWHLYLIVVAFIISWYKPYTLLYLMLLVKFYILPSFRWRRR